MALTDPAEWRLFGTDLTTQLDVLPFKTSHIYTELNAPGSGEVTIPLDTPAGANVGIGKFCALYYRGQYRAGFFIDALKYTDADSSENGGRIVSMSGRGELSLLEGSVIWATGSETTREFTNVTKASILITLIDEAQARGELATLTYTFTATEDSNAVAWTDSENYSLAVGTNLLDVARQFAETGGFDYSLDFSAGFALNADSGGRGSNISTTTSFRIGEQCEEVGRDTRGEEIYNYYLVKWRDGYIAVSDATSIATYGIRSKFLSLEQAQSSESATTYAAARLALTKDPQANKTLKVYDGIKPRLFVDYDLGDTVSLDRLGTVTTDRIMGIQADFDGSEFSHIIIDFNYLLRINEMNMSAQLDWLTDQWNTAHDGNLMEVRQGMSLGNVNGMVNAIHKVGDYLYIGGGFTLIGNLSVSYTARYQISTHTWAALTGISAETRRIIDVSGTVYACTSTGVYSLSGTTWSQVGNVTAGDLRCMTTDGTDLYVGGAVTTISGVSIAGKVAMWDGAVWIDVVTNPMTYFAQSMTFFNSVLHVGFGGVPAGSSNLRRLNGSPGAGSWTNLLNLGDVYIRAMKEIDDNLIFSADDGSNTCEIYSWDGVSIGPGIGSAVILGTISDYTVPSSGAANAINNYLTDIYFGGDFSTLDGTSGFNGIAKYSGGLWSFVSSGVSQTAGDGVHAIELEDTDIYVGGIFSTAFGLTVTNLSIYVTNFESMVDHLANDPNYNFDMGAAIHNATAAAITSTGEIPFWDSVTAALRKITWANIIATLKAAIKLDEWAAPTDVTTLNATTSLHGLLIKATAPGAGVRNVVAIDNGETVYKNTALVDSTNPADIGTAAPGTSLIAARRDHVHAGSFLNLSNLPLAETNANDIFRVDSPGGVSLWTGTISGAPSGTSVTVSAPTSGTEAVLVPTSTSQLAKLKLYNLTRSNSALISNYNTGTNVVTLTATVPGTWANGDSLTIVSQTVSGGAGKNWVDIVITTTLTSKTSLFMDLTCFSATAADQMHLHPYETYSASKVKTQGALVASLINEGTRLLPIISDTFALSWGTSPTAVVIREAGYLQ